MHIQLEELRFDSIGSVKPGPMVRIIRPWIPALHKGSLSDYLIVLGKITETRAIEE